MASLADGAEVQLPVPDAASSQTARRSSRHEAGVRGVSSEHVATFGVGDVPPPLALLACLPDPLFVLDAEGRITRLSLAWEAMTGLLVSDTLGCVLSAMAHEDDEAEVSFQLQCLLSRETAVWRGAFRLATTNCRSLWVEIQAIASDGTDGVVGTLRDGTLAREREMELQQLALRDPLLGIPNRALLLDRLERRCERFRRRQGRPFALVLVDINDLELINDAFGHVARDEALRAVAARLTSAVCFSDTVARSGIGEFAVLLDEVHENQDVPTLSAHVFSAVSRPLMLAGESVELPCSIGVVISSASIEQAGDLVDHARKAIYEAKRKGSGAAAAYSSPRLDHGPTPRIWLYRS